MCFDLRAVCTAEMQVPLDIAIQCVWILCAWQICIGLEQSVAVDIQQDVYCETETFNATCGQTEVLLMTYARYGRMNIGRCVKKDYGHIGCASDVIVAADKRCSGKTECIIHIPDPQFALLTPCPGDLKPYLEVGYICVKVPLYEARTCDVRKVRVPLTYSPIFDAVDPNPSCAGKPHSRFVIAGEGQRIRVHLYDLRAAYRAVKKQSSDSGCQMYAQVTEKLTTGLHHERICSASIRHVTAYTSITNRIEIKMAAVKNGIAFFLKYEAIGCADIAPVLHAISQRRGDSYVIKCKFSRYVYRLKCLGNNWRGNVGNCTTIPPHPIDNGTYDQSSVPYGVSVLIVLVIALLVGLLVLAVGIVTLKRYVWCRENRNSTLEKDNERNIWREQNSADPSPALYRRRHSWQDPSNISFHADSLSRQMPPSTPLLEHKPPLYGHIQSATLPCGCTAYVTHADISNYHLATNNKTLVCPVATPGEQIGTSSYFVLDACAQAKTPTQTQTRSDKGVKSKRTTDSQPGDVCCAHDDCSPRRDEHKNSIPIYTQHTNPPDISYTAMCRSSIDNSK